MKNEEHFNELTPDELERLAILAEEAAEVQQIVMKIIRHGYSSHNPFDEKKLSNRKLLEIELGHLQYIGQQMAYKKDIDNFRVNLSSAEKAKSIKKYLHHNEFPHE